MDKLYQDEGALLTATNVFCPVYEPDNWIVEGIAMPQNVVPSEDVAVEVDFGIWMLKRFPGLTANATAEP